MALAATCEQKELLNERGFFVIEEYLDADEVAGLNDAFDEVGARLRGERGMNARPAFDEVGDAPASASGA